MPTFRHGKNTVFKFGTSGTPATPVDYSTSMDEVGFPRSVDTGETTTFGVTGSAKTYVVGLVDGTISFSGKFDATTDAGIAGILGFDTPVSFEYGPEGSTTGRVKYSGSAILTSYEVTGQVGDVVSAKGEFQITGPVTRGAY